MTLEQGKPLAESLGEIRYAASFIEWFAEQAKRTNGDIIPSPSGDKRLMVLKQGHRRVRGDHAMELPGGDDHPQGRAGAGGRLHAGGQARQRNPLTRRWRWPSWPSAPAFPPGCSTW